jgi:uncharacterized protein YutE (UPF0331/DUF86 family)
VIDHNRVLQKLRLIEENLRKLASLGEGSEDSFLRSFREYDSAKYNLQATIEAMLDLDICNHIISRMTLGIPMTNADSFRILCRENILSPEKEGIYRAMARFRNRVVHMYDQVDNRQVYRTQG